MAYHDPALKVDRVLTEEQERGLTNKEKQILVKVQKYEDELQRAVTAMNKGDKVDFDTNILVPTAKEINFYKQVFKKPEIRVTQKRTPHKRIAANSLKRMRSPTFPEELIKYVSEYSDPARQQALLEGEQALREQRQKRALLEQYKKRVSTPKHNTPKHNTPKHNTPNHNTSKRAKTNGGKRKTRTMRKR
jgi:hypothetical protein